MNMKAIVGAVLVFIMIGCTSVDQPMVHEGASSEQTPFRKPLKDYSPFFQKIIGKEGSPFRGITMGMKMSEVRAVEEAHHEETDSLTVRYDFEDGIANNVEVEYLFSQDSVLESMDLTVFCARSNFRDSLFADLKNYISQREKIVGNDSLFNWKFEGGRVEVKKGGIPEFPEITILYR